MSLKTWGSGGGYLGFSPRIRVISPAMHFLLSVFVFSSVLRKRIREDRKANTAQKVQEMKQRLNETERKRKRWLYWQPILTKMGFVSFILVGAFVGWTLLFQQNVL